MIADLETRVKDDKSKVMQEEKLSVE